MNTSNVDVIFYDGLSSKPHHAQVHAVDEHTVLVRYGDELELERRYLYADMTLIGALGKINPVIELKDEARLEFKDVLPEWFQLGAKKTYHSIWKLEKSPSLILFSVIFVAALIFATVKWGVPTASYYVAKNLPEDTLKTIGDEAEEYIVSITGESTLSTARQKQILERYNSIIADTKPAKVIFRAGKRIGANALAIPNNTIILTDELVKLAKNDDEIVGVLAHEQGHLTQKHSLQQTLSSLGFSVILIAITGDGSDLVTTVPAALIGAKYSRDFESEADAYALNTMHQHQIPTVHFANFLQRLEDSANTETSEDEASKNEKSNSEGQEDGSSVLDFLQSHPATSERIQAVKDFESKQQK